MTEVWQSLPEYPLIELSNLGGIRKFNSIGEEIEISLCPVGKPGYLTFNYWIGKKLYKRYLHRKVMLLFGPPQPDKLSHVCFLDRDPSNCAVSNLYWSSQELRMKRRKEENRYAMGEDHFLAVFTNEQVKEMKTLYKTGKYSAKQIAEMFNGNHCTVTNILNGGYWKHIQV